MRTSSRLVTGARGQTQRLRDFYHAVEIDINKLAFLKVSYTETKITSSKLKHNK